MQIKSLAVRRRAIAAGLALGVAVMGAFLAGRVHAQITFTGPALLYVQIRADKTADYEDVVAKFRQAIQKTGSAQLKRQAAGWRIYRSNAKPTDNMILYVHVLDPVVPNADYSLMPVLYEAYSDPEQQAAIFNQYKDAFGGQTPLPLTLVADLSR